VTSSSQSETAANDGFVLVAVLWMLAALTTLISIYSAYALNTAAASHVTDDRIQAEASIRSGVEIAAYRKLAGSEAQSAGRFEVQVGRTRVVVRLSPETARIDINAAPKDLLTGLFVELGVDQAQAEFLTDRVIGWRDKADAGHGAEAQLYLKRNVPYQPRQAPFESALELSLLPEISPALVERALPLVTIFSGRGQVDAMSAPPTILSALPGMTPEILASILKGRASDPGDVKAILDLFGPAKRYATADESNAVRAAIEVVFDNGRRVHADVVFRVRESGDQPYDLLYWSDDFDGSASPA
jgi:general secretion pathway protein K